MAEQTRTKTTAHSEATEVRTVAELLDRGLVAGQYPRNFPLADAWAFDAVRRRVVRTRLALRQMRLAIGWRCAFLTEYATASVRRKK